MLSALLQTAFSENRTLPNFLIRLENYGLLDAAIPFILIFAVVFTVSKRVKILGENKSVHMLLALCLALLVIIPHITGKYPPGQDVVSIINNALPNVSLVIVIIVAGLILAGLFLGDNQSALKGGIFPLLAVGIIVYIFGMSAGWWNSFTGLNFLSNPDVQAVTIIVLVFALVIFMITSDNPMDSATRGATGFMNFFRGLGGGGGGG